MFKQLVGVVSTAFAAAVASPLVAALPDTYYPYCVNATERVIWKNVNLADLSGVDGFLCGGHLDAMGRVAQCKYWNYDAGTGKATCQFQIWDGTYTKSVKVEFTQDGSDVKAVYVYGKYIGANKVGENFDTLAGTTTQASIPDNPSGTSYGIYELSPVYTSSPITYGHGASLSWNNGASWTAANAWSASGTATTWREWATPVFTGTSTVPISGLVRIASWNRTNQEGTDPVLDIPAGTVTLTDGGNGVIAYRGGTIKLVEGAKLVSEVPWSPRNGQTFAVDGPGEVTMPAFASRPGAINLKNGAKVVFSTAGTDSGRPRQDGYDNVLDLGGGSWTDLPSFGANSSCTYLNGTYTSTPDWNLSGNTRFILGDGCTFDHQHRFQMNNGHVEVLAGGKWKQKCDVNPYYGTLVGLDASNTYNTFKVNGGEVEINVDKMGQNAGGFQIACKGGSYDNTTGRVEIVSGKATVATIMMTSDWQPTMLARGWRSGSNGTFVQTGGELVTWKIFAGNTTLGGGREQQTWTFTGGTGTIGSIRNGVFTPLDFTFDGYTVKAYEDVEKWFLQDGMSGDSDAKAGRQHFVIGSRGLTFDTNGKTVGVDFSVWEINGPITKAGAGMLRIDSDLAGVAVNVTGGTLAFGRPATVGELTLADGTALAATPGANGFPALTATSLTLAEGGSATIKLYGTAPVNGTYPVLIAPNLDLADFTLDTTALAGGTATLVAGDNNTISVKVTGGTMPYTYRGPTANTLWGDDATVWQNALGALVAWVDGAHTIFDGAGAAGITVTDPVVAGDVSFSGNADFTLKGTNVVSGAGTITKTGTGKLTLDGANFAQQEIVINGGQVELGANVGAKSLGGDSGSGAGSVTIANGGQFNLNYLATAANNTDARAEPTQLKTFKIAGAGSDGRGAIVNDATDGREVHNTVWNSAFRRIELTDDATIGGVDRFDVRVRSGTAATATGGIFGPGKELTVKTTGYFGLVSLPIEVQSVKITDGGVLRPENLTEAQISIPGGITLDNGTLHAYGTTWPATTALTVTENGGEIATQSGTTTFKGSVTIAEGGEFRLTQGAAADVHYDGVVTNLGTVAVKGGTHAFTKESLEGDGEWNVAGGNLFWFGTFDLGKPRTLNLSGGNFYYGEVKDGTERLSDKVTVNATGGNVIFNIGKTSTLTSDDLEVTGTPGGLYLYGNSGSVTTLKDFTFNGTGSFGVGNASNPTTFVLDDGVDITVNGTMLVGDGGSKPLPSSVTIKEGASVTVKGAVWIGHWSGETSNRHEVIVDGGTLNYLGTDHIRMGWDANYAYLTLNAGTINTGSFCCRPGWKDPNTFAELFEMNGGTLNLKNPNPSSARNAFCAWTHFEPFVQLNAGTVNYLTPNLDVEQLRAVGFGNRSGGHLNFNIGEQTIQWRTGLAGAADVSLQGTGNFNTGVGNVANLRLQGVLTGEWTIENTGNNNLYGAAAFQGGLHLTNNVTANLRIAGSNLVQAVYLQNGSDTFAATCGYSAREFPFACNDLTMMHAKSGSADYSNANVMWQGQFYADTAGTWTFAGGYDDSVRMDVDGAKVFECTDWSAVASGQVALTVGWHDFKIVQYQAGGGWGAVPAGWVNVMNIGFAKSAVDNTTAANYTKFDGQHIPLRAWPVTKGGVLQWRSVKGFNDSTWKTRTDLTENGTFKLSQLHTYNFAATPTFSGSTHEFSGWVFVGPKQAGDWKLFMTYDDRGAVWLDEVDTGVSGQSKTTVDVKGVTAGWHKVRIRVADNTGSWGPWGNSGKYCTVAVNGTTYNFDETAFFFSATKPRGDYAGLDGEVRLDEGSTLTNVATAEACPIWGTLKGTGTLNGFFAFKGEQNCWAVTGPGNLRKLEAVAFADADPMALADLKQIKATFGQKPGCSLYEVGQALGADPAKIALEVKDAAGKDYSEEFSVRVQDGKLYLKNEHPSGTTLFLR